MKPAKVLTGDRPTGKLHLGNWVGSLKTRVRLQDDYRCFFVVADLHALTTEYERPRMMKQNVRELMLDYLSVGIDPEKSAIFLQSLIPEVAELHVLFSMLVRANRLQRVPALRDTVRAQHLKQASLGLLAYPVLQAADILMVRANLVPVGADQIPHLEVTREIARDFNRLYGPVFPVPEIVPGAMPLLPGIDGEAKMSKSLGNAIHLSDDAETVVAKVRRMNTDPAHTHVTDAGRVLGNPVFIYHEAFNPDRAEVDELKVLYRAGQVGDTEVKERLARAINAFLAPIRENRRLLAMQPRRIEEILAYGSEVARKEAQTTLALAREAMGLIVRLG